jgi:hypothetical protein
MALTTQQIQTFTEFYAETKLTLESQVEFILQSKAAQKAEVQAWWDAKKATLQTRKAAQNQALLDAEIAKLDTLITNGDDLITNL